MEKRIKSEGRNGLASIAESGKNNSNGTSDGFISPEAHTDYNRRTACYFANMRMAQYGGRQ